MSRRAAEPPRYLDRCLWGMILRDLTVLRRGLAPFITRTVMNPLLFVFIFTYVLPHIGQQIQTGAWPV